MLLFALTTSAFASHGDDHAHGNDHGNHGPGWDDDDVCEPDSSSVFAYMPDPVSLTQPTGRTYPEGVTVIGNRVIVSGAANFGTAGNGSPSQLTVFDLADGDLVSEVPVVGEYLQFEHALSELASWHGYAYAPSTQLGVLRWDFRGNDDTPAQESVSTPFCSATGYVPCHVDTDACPADIRAGLPPLPNGITLDEQGTIYVSDALQGIVWRIGDDGVPDAVVCATELQGSGTEGLGLFGANGIAAVDGLVYVAVSFGPMSAFGPTSVIYRFDPSDPVLELVYTFEPVQVAPGVFVPPILDGLRYDAENDRLLGVLGGQNAVVELDLSEDPVVEVARYTRMDADLPFVNPSTVAITDDGRAFVSNHAITMCLSGDPNPACTAYGAEDYFAVIEVCRE